MSHRSIPHHPVRFGISKQFLRLSLLFLLLIPVLFSACSAPQVPKSQAKGVYHVVKKGETAYSIARAYSIGLQDLAEINNISDVSNIKEGTILFIPDATVVIDDVMVQAGKAGADLRLDQPENGKAPEKPKIEKPIEKQPVVKKEAEDKPVSGVESGAVPSKAEKPATEKQDDVKLEKGRFAWPVKGDVKTRFGVQPNKTYHSWIKIVCPAGAQIKAAASGIVIYSASLPSFGETIIIRHPDHFTTVYTHLKKRTVKADQHVKKGEGIAVAGEKDSAGETYIHFEVRHKGNKPLNPLSCLP